MQRLTASPDREQAEMLLDLRHATEVIRDAFARDRAWWARNDPVGYVWLCRAERRGARVPWSGTG